MTELIIGAEGWQHAQWIDQFYPDDLPQDWRFSFYCNEFQSVILTSSELSADPQEISSWLDECDDDFIFIGDLSGQMDWQECLQPLSIVQANLYGVLFSQDQASNMTDKQIMLLVEQVVDISPIYIKGATEELLQEFVTKLNKIQQYLPKNRVNRVHFAENIQQTLHFLPNNTETELVLFKSANKLSAKELRQIMENCIECFKNTQRVCLFFVGNDVAMDNMRDATMIYHLMA